ncbi:hypothetical protein M501DRAFT_985104 [Patellaria atrata CBS 101060]|uniref:Hydrophobin n=1 Tax=Patellaria atrata CBS 101060 TaxID=1346257 RepID=A0A9P4SHC4_9PEZI|nr:hypothetical protein M501DRAFT_985104 [Patellaria atrata CBS 101060]
MRFPFLHAVCLPLGIGAVPALEPRKCPVMTCATSTDVCGDVYGGCYDKCKGDIKYFYLPPACATPHGLENAGVLHPTLTAVPFIETLCELGKQTICVDVINSCGIRYGGCHDK